MPSREFTTDANGDKPKGVRLFANTMYESSPSIGRPANRLNDIPHLLTWINGSVLGDLRTLKRGIDVNEIEPMPQHGGGNFLLFAACLMALEYFSRIYVAAGTAHARVRKYSEDFLVPINPRYGDATGIMWRAARNGMLHASWPSRFGVEGSSKEYIFNVGNSIQEDHLTFVNGVLNISGPQLLHDLEQSVQTGLSPWIEESGDASLLARGQPCVVEVKESDILHKQEIAAMLAWSNG